ncbi:MAG: phenylacetate--CoA ligase family protein [Leptolyngbya sp. UWPOB_LEPTO1]|uniref:phenylacetate--CoA ligase family protein n=1 Tax=Leptolyngbya sp. UWPOB_LEPTO1 TaxID=2815653 RepID=UPI001ACE4742|nr:phenylacetate--CoA ligase family protein [Leptolyngbya sp. UWPOB_LEPTO1]MBN8560270.1 phenylacetate--CoA ligase family protein [Leptolyngbya sp. UWPOB_LEPTO1]
MLSSLQSFLTTPLSDRLRSTPGEAETEVIRLFQTVAAHVPAYRSFLQEHNIDPASIQTFADFQTLPLTTKSSYLKRYSLAQLCRNGKLEACDMIAVSSGSTGQPSFFPRSLSDEFQIATRFEQIFHDSFQADQKRTLAIVCFALGTWVGGMFTASCCRHVASKGYPITVITPGNQKAEIFRVLEALAPEFEQVVLLGYPPFLKDVIDSGIAQGVPWQNYHIKWVSAGEVFSEAWRSLVGQRIGSTNINYDSASLYGTADAGVLGNETPLSICIRRWLAEHPDAARELFGESRLPTLVQYDPLSRFFEVQDGTLLFSGDSGLPLIRYHIADNGGVLTYEQMIGFLAAQGFDPIQELQGDRGIHPLPFVYVFGRSAFTVSYFGANVYPENVSVGLEQSPICDWVTGKFVMQVKEDDDRNSIFSIVVELAPNVTASEEKQQAIAIAILQQLQRLNSEFANYVPQAYQLPQITLKTTGDPEYFPPGVKHRYTRPSNA